MIKEDIISIIQNLPENIEVLYSMGDGTAGTCTSQKDRFLSYVKDGEVQIRVNVTIKD